MKRIYLSAEAFLEKEESYYIPAGTVIESKGWNIEKGFYIDIREAIDTKNSENIEGEKTMGIEKDLQDLCLAIKENTEALRKAIDAACVKVAENSDKQPDLKKEAAKAAPLTTKAENTFDVKGEKLTRKEIIARLKNEFDIAAEPKMSSERLATVLALSIDGNPPLKPKGVPTKKENKSLEAESDDLFSGENEEGAEDDFFGNDTKKVKNYSVDEVRELAKKAMNDYSEEAVKPIFKKYGGKLVDLPQEKINSLANEIINYKG